MHYLSKQDLASAYFPDNSKESASKRFANEIHSNKPLLDALRPTILTDLSGRREEVRLTPDAPGQYTLDLTSRSSARTSTGGPLLLTLTTADGRQHTIRLLKQSDIFSE